MAIIKQTFNLGGNVAKAFKSKREYDYLSSEQGWEDFVAGYDGDWAETEAAYNKALGQQAKQSAGATKKALGSAKAYTLAVASFTYNYIAKTTRFGLRGQDIQDQLKLQDKMVNKAFGIVGAGLVAGLPGMAVATIGMIVSEAISISIQNKAYEYRKMIDEQQKSIMQERIGRAVYNSSRRG